MRTEKAERAYRRKRKKIRDEKRRKGLCTYSGCDAKVSRRLMSKKPYSMCDKHRGYMKRLAANGWD